MSHFVAFIRSFEFSDVRIRWIRQRCHLKKTSGEIFATIFWTKRLLFGIRKKWYKKGWRTFGAAAVGFRLVSDVMRWWGLSKWRPWWSASCWFSRRSSATRPWRIRTIRTDQDPSEASPSPSRRNPTQLFRSTEALIRSMTTSSTTCFRRRMAIVEIRWVIRWTWAEIRRAILWTRAEIGSEIRQFLAGSFLFVQNVVG